MEIKEYLSILVNVIMLMINVFFYIIVAPKVDYKLKNREKFYNISGEYLEYLVLVTSNQKFDNVLDKNRAYSIKVQLLFKDGKAPTKLRACLQNIYLILRKRIKAQEDFNQKLWYDEMRQEILNLRKLLTKYRNKIKW